MGDVDYLYEDDSTGQLRVDPASGKAFRAKEQASGGGASLSGPMPAFGRGVWEAPGNRGGNGSPQERKPLALGMGASMPSPLVAHAMSEGRTRRYTPEELHSMADQMEQELLAAQIKDKGPAVVADRVDGSAPPSWLTQYMSKQPNMGEAQVLTSGDLIRNSKYGSDEDKKKVASYQALKPWQRK